jgi:hypothetical protein
MKNRLIETHGGAVVVGVSAVCPHGEEKVAAVENSRKMIGYELLIFETKERVCQCIYSKIAKKRVGQQLCILLLA